MSSRGELFINKDVYNMFKNELDKMFGKDNWSLAVNGYYDLWDERLFPDIVEVDIMDEMDKKIGELKVSVKFFVEGDSLNGCSVEVEPDKLLSLTKLE